jgi:4-hydroxybenzoate polyprenyltransferase
MRSVIGWVQATHPFPLLAVVGLTALIGVASAGGELDAERLARVVAAMFFAQLVIGWTNDYVDRDADARFQPSKPIPSGLVSARLLPFAASLAGLLALAVAGTLGWLPAVCVALGMGSGLAYNFALKPTSLSWAPYVVAFCVLPPFVWGGLDVWDAAFVALYPIALPLTVAAHLANALPDIETDRESGRSSVVVRLGRAMTLRLLRVILLLPVGLAIVSTRFVTYDVVVLVETMALYAALLGLSGFAYLTANGQRGNDVWGFRLVVAASLVFVTGWLLSVK